MGKKSIILVFLSLLFFYILYTVNQDIFQFTDIYSIGREFERELDKKGDYILTSSILLKRGTFEISVIGTSDGVNNSIFVMSGEEIVKRVDFLKGQTELKIQYEVQKPSEQIRIGGYYDQSSDLFSIEEISFYSDHVIYKDSVLFHITISLFWLVIFGFLFFRFLFTERYQRTIGKYITPSMERTFLFILLLTIFICYPIYTPDYVKGDDSTFHISRIEGIKTSLSYGYFPARIHLFTAFDYGYGAGLFYPDAFLYFPAILRLLGFDFILAFKIFFFFINFFSILSMFLAARSITKSRYAGIAAAILYTFAAYRIVDFYNRGAIGEALAFIFIPLIIWGIYEIFEGNPKHWYILAIGFTGLTLSHLISLALVGIFTLIFLLVNCKKMFSDREIIFAVAKAFIVTVGISAYFLFPFFEQLLLNNVGLVSTWRNPIQSGLPVSTIFVGFAGWELPVKPSVGYPLLFIPVLRLLLYRVNLNMIKVIDTFIVIGVIAIIFTTNLFPWDSFEWLNTYIQFPWRFLMIATPILSIAGGGLIDLLVQKQSRQLTLVMLFIFCSLYTIPAFSAIESNNIINVHGYHLEQNRVGNGEFLPKKAEIDFLDRNRNQILSSDPAFINHEFNRSGLRFTFQFSVEDDSVDFEIPLLYYKGYRAELMNGEEIKPELPVYSGAHGLTAVTINGIKEGTISVYYTGTIVQKIGDLITLITIIVLFLRFFLFIHHNFNGRSSKKLD